MSTAKAGARQFAELESLLAAKMRKSLDGDAQAYRELLREVRDVLTGYFSRHLGRCGISDHAFVDDLVQETLIGIHEKRHTFDRSQPFTPWMYAIARYKLIDLARRRKHVKLQDDVEALDGLAAVLPVEDPSVSHDLEGLLGGLPERQRQVVELTKIQGLSVAAVAEKTGMSVSAVKVTVHRAIKALKKRLQEEKR